MARSKSTFTRENQIFLELLRKEREDAGVSQVELAKRLKQTQTYVSKCERGERRLDLVETRWYCQGIGITFADFAAKFDAAIQSAATSKRSAARRAK
jgi:transcriptional regulator with XRE-family HTH domain